MSHTVCIGLKLVQNKLLKNLHQNNELWKEKHVADDNWKVLMWSYHTCPYNMKLAFRHCYKDVHIASVLGATAFRHCNKDVHIASVPGATGEIQIPVCVCARCCDNFLYLKSTPWLDVGSLSQACDMCNDNFRVPSRQSSKNSSCTNSQCHNCCTFFTAPARSIRYCGIHYNHDYHICLSVIRE